MINRKILVLALMRTQLFMLPESEQTLLWSKMLHKFMHFSPMSKYCHGKKNACACACKHRKTQSMFLFTIYTTEYKHAAFHQSHQEHKIFQTPGLLRSLLIYSAVTMLQIYKPSQDDYDWDVPAQIPSPDGRTNASHAKFQSGLNFYSWVINLWIKGVLIETQIQP